MEAVKVNLNVSEWVQNVISMTNPKEVVWIDGSEEQLDNLKVQACESGELHKLNEKKLPNCYYHRSNPNDVARIEHRTFICCKDKKNAGPTNNWMNPCDAYKIGREIFENSMENKTMYIIPYMMGPIGSPFSKIGFEITDSIYVVLNMNIMTRIGDKVLDELDDDSDDFVRGVHAKCNLDEEKRYIFHFPEDNTIWSCNSAYGGNVLLGKKCFALRIASYQGLNEGWMAEHMLILGIENPEGEVKYITAAFPSACGKTNLAMIIPPEGYVKDGYKVWTVGDDIAWLRVGDDGRLWAVNPEAGFFGVAPGTNIKSNKNALLSTQKDSIFTNVVLNLDDNTVWWEKLNDTPPTNALDWQGNPWDGTKATTNGAHPNSRFTSPAKNCPVISPNWEDPQGVPISAIIFGGRRAKTAPLVYESKDWIHGVFVGATMASETTAAASGKVGIVRRDPMAMLPFCGYNMADYFKHWINMGEKISNPPKIFHVNWFRTDENNNFMWPGFGDNFRVIDWILKRCENQVSARYDKIGYLPNFDDLNTDDLNMSKDYLEKLFELDKEAWNENIDGIEEFFSKFNGSLPDQFYEEVNLLKKNFS